MYGSSVMLVIVVAYCLVQLVIFNIDVCIHEVTYNINVINSVAILTIIIVTIMLCLCYWQTIISANILTDFKYIYMSLIIFHNRNMTYLYIIVLPERYYGVLSIAESSS